jgi:hypothetical protein
METKERKTSTVLSILDTWPEYYEHMDEGIGTTYERFILHRYFIKLKEEYNVQSIIETPSFGMTGVSLINSIWWSAQGITPTVLDTNDERIEKSQKVWDSVPLPVNLQKINDAGDVPFSAEEFDMSWNFASLWFVKNMPDYIAALCKATKKVIFICVPNANGFGYHLRTKFNNEVIPDFYLKNILPKNFVPLFEQNGWKKKKAGYLDIPPWPDIAMKKEDMLRKAGLGFLVKEDQEGGETTFEKKCIVDFFKGTNPGLEENILKYDFLEKAPFPIKQVWGHHRWFIFEPQN